MAVRGKKLGGTAMKPIINPAGARLEAGVKLDYRING